MIRFGKYFRVVIICLVVAGVLLVVTYNIRNHRDRLPGVVHFSGKKFAGSSTCVSCHPSIAESHFQSPHFLTSAPASSLTVKGSFDSAENILVLNERLKITMEETPEGLFQRGFIDGVEVEKKPFHITIGSGRQGQTYLYWEDNSLFQLPASYYTHEDTWSNSPGYPPDQILFRRSIPARCIECHSTYVKIGQGSLDHETFDRSQMMLGVDCERCHGPAEQHVTFHQKYPEEREAKHIINPAHLTRQQRLDNCALCHSGIRDSFMPPFSYVVGDKLDDYFFPSNNTDGASTLDVHGNQYGLLTSSKCFRRSEMDCSSCHNVHVKETKNVNLFSQRCMNCHQSGSENFCTQPEIPGLVLSNNCIDCHMPALPSRQVFLRGSSSSGQTPFFVRTHLIGNYKEQVKLFLEKIEREKVGLNE